MANLAISALINFTDCFYRLVLTVLNIWTFVIEICFGLPWPPARSLRLGERDCYLDISFVQYGVDDINQKYCCNPGLGQGFRDLSAFGGFGFRIFSSVICLSPDR